MEYRRSLDGMRGVAVAAVVAYHVDIYRAHKIFPGGWAGVDVFFVLSGFLISAILLKEMDQFGRIDMRDFYYRRVIRLAPALLLLLVVLAGVSVIDKAARPQDFTNILLSLTYLMNWWRAFSSTPGTGGFLGHTWSLSVEEQFYTLWPVTVLLLVRARKQASLIIAALIAVAILWRGYLVAHGATYERTYNGFDTHADPILIGCLIAFLPGVITKSRRYASRFVIIPILTLAVILLKMHLFSRYGQYIGVTASAACAAWILVATFEDGFVTRALSFKPLVYTGRISYGWYLWHYPVLFVANHAHRMSTVENVVLVLATYLIAMASFHFVERPISVQFKHRLRRLRQPMVQEA